VLLPVAGRRPRQGRVARGLALITTATALWLGGAGAARAATVTVDKLVSTNQTTAAATIASPAFTTTASNELLVAFVGSDGPMAAGAQTFATVTGGGLTWTLRP